MNASGERPGPPADPAGKKGSPPKITALALWLSGAVAVGFAWGIVETLIIRVAFPAGPYLHRDLVHALNGRVIFYGTLTLLLSALVTAAIWLWKRLRRRTTPMPAAGRYALVASAALGAYVNLALAVLPYWRAKFELAKRAPQLGFLTALSAAVVLAGGILLLAWLRRRSRLFRMALPYASYCILAAALVAGASSLAYQRYRLLSRPGAAGLPDVVVITLDAWRADVFNEELTPNISTYARKNGLVFTDARAFSSWTLPSFAAALTGTYNVTSVSGIMTEDEHLPTWAEVMRDNGYDTYAILSNPHLDTARYHFRGFSHFYYVKRKPVLSHFRFYDTALYFAIRGLKYPPEIPGETTRRLTDKTLRLLRGTSRRPKFVWVHYLDPHYPYQPLPGVWEEKAPTLLDKIHYGTEREAFTEDNAGVLKRLYEEEVRSTDLLLAPLLRELDGRERTVVIISSDHGEEFFEHGGREHGRTLYDELCEVPLVVSLPPGDPNNSRPGLTNGPVSLMDLAPSVLDYLGLPVPPTMAGRRDILSRKTLRDQPVYLSLNRPNFSFAALIENDRKIIAKTGGAGTSTEYFDLEADPMEERPLPLDDKGERLREKLLKWSREKTLVSEAGIDGAPLFGERADLKALGYM